MTVDTVLQRERGGRGGGGAKVVQDQDTIGYMLLLTCKHEDLGFI